LIEIEPPEQLAVSFRFSIVAGKVDEVSERKYARSPRIG
jgi:hypothetical protein